MINLNDILITMKLHLSGRDGFEETMKSCSTEMEKNRFINSCFALMQNENITPIIKKVSNYAKHRKIPVEVKDFFTQILKYYLQSPKVFEYKINIKIDIEVCQLFLRLILLREIYNYCLKYPEIITTELINTINNTNQLLLKKSQQLYQMKEVTNTNDIDKEINKVMQFFCLAAMMLMLVICFEFKNKSLHLNKNFENFDNSLAMSMKLLMCAFGVKSTYHVHCAIKKTFSTHLFFKFESVAEADIHNPRIKKHILLPADMFKQLKLAQKLAENLKPNSPNFLR